MLARVSESPEFNDVDEDLADTRLKTARNASAFSDYLGGLDHIKRVVSELNTNLVGTLNDYYQTKDSDETAYNNYLVKISDAFSQCNLAITRRGHSSIIVDGQVQIAVLINKVKESDQDLNTYVVTIIEYWENIKYAVESIQQILDNFERRVAARLRKGCVGFGDSLGFNLHTSDAYSREASTYVQEIETTAVTIRLLASSSANRTTTALLTKSSLSNRLLRDCDEENFPILQVVPELTIKMESLFRVARMWLDRDETYIFDISKEIRDTRHKTQNREEVLKQEKENQKTLVKSVKKAYLVCQNSKRKLKEMAAEIKKLEHQTIETSLEQRKLLSDKEQKENTSSFLEVSISQTRKNYSLQLKRQKLLRQVKELETQLIDVDQHIVDLKEQIQSKMPAFTETKAKYESDEKSYQVMRNDLDTFSRNVRLIQNELNNMRVSLVQLESIQAFKTSPERVDEFYDAKPKDNIQLSKSLQDKIQGLKKLSQQKSL